LKTRLSRLLPAVIRALRESTTEPNEEASRERRRRDEANSRLLEAAPDATGGWNRRGPSFGHAQVERLFGYRREEVLKPTDEHLVAAAFHSQHAGHSRRLFDGLARTPHGTRGVELLGLHKDGCRFSRSKLASVLWRNDEGTLSRGDPRITERKQPRKRWASRARRHIGTSSNTIPSSGVDRRPEAQRLRESRWRSTQGSPGDPLKARLEKALRHDDLATHVEKWLTQWLPGERARMKRA